MAEKLSGIACECGYDLNTHDQLFVMRACRDYQRHRAEQAEAKRARADLIGWLKTEEDAAKAEADAADKETPA